MGQWPVRRFKILADIYHVIICKRTWIDFEFQLQAIMSLLVSLHLKFKPLIGVG